MDRFSVAAATGLRGVQEGTGGRRFPGHKLAIAGGNGK